MTGAVEGEVNGNGGPEALAGAQQTIGMWLSSQRLARGWSEAEMARQLHSAARAVNGQAVPSVASLASYVWRWEHGRRIPSSRYRALYCRVLGLELAGFGRVPPPAGAPCPVCGGPGKSLTRGPHAAGGQSNDSGTAPGNAPFTELDPRFWTVAEAAGLMRVAKMTVYRMVHSGELESKRIGRGFRIPEQAVRDYLRNA